MNNKARKLAKIKRSKKNPMKEGSSDFEASVIAAIGPEKMAAIRRAIDKINEREEEYNIWAKIMFKGVKIANL